MKHEVEKDCNPQIFGTYMRKSHEPIVYCVSKIQKKTSSKALLRKLRKVSLTYSICFSPYGKLRGLCNDMQKRFILDKKALFITCSRIARLAKW